MMRFCIAKSALCFAAMLTLTAPAASVTTRRCEDIPTFYKTVEDANGIKYAVGQCLPSKSPGAYYTKTGEKDANHPKNDRNWKCFSPDSSKDLWTDDDAEIEYFDGACLLADFDNNMKPEDVEDCSNHLSHHPAVCSPGPSMYWGACWSSVSEQWKCVPHNDVTIPGLAKGDCKAQVVLHEDGSPTKHFYDGVCRFKEEKVVKYRCDTVPGYDAKDATTCGGGSLPKSACFTLHKGANWRCFQKGQISVTPCEWTLLDGNEEFYKGTCVFKGSSEYRGAIDARHLVKSEVGTDVKTAANVDAERMTAEEAEKKRLEAEKPNAEEPAKGHAEGTAAERFGGLRNLKWRWAENLVFGVPVPKTRFQDSWNMPADRAALIKELETKVGSASAEHKEYKTRKLEFADADYPDRRKTFADFSKALEWLMVKENIRSRDEM